MSIEKELEIRSSSKCEMCSSLEGLQVFEVEPSQGVTDDCIMVCTVCLEQINDPEKVDVNHWRCLNDSMWSEVPAVQVVAWRMLTRLKGEGWTQDLLEMLYLDDATQKWAEATVEGEETGDAVIHKDSNGVTLQAGDNVVLIKDLPVKGSSLVAKRGTAVRNISLDRDNAEYIEGKVSGQTIVIITKYIKKT